MAVAASSTKTPAKTESPVARHRNLLIAIGAVSLAVVFPFTQDPLGTLLNNCILALAYIVMALGLNIVVGFAGLLDLGYVAFYALGAYSMGWLASDFYSEVNGGNGVFFLVGEGAKLAGAGIHVNFLFVCVVAIALCALFGMLIGLPTLRLRGDYIAIVTLAFGEIIYRFAANGDSITFGSEATKLTNGRQAISPVDPIKLPGLSEFDSAFNLRQFYWLVLAMAVLTLFINFRLRDSRLGRAWVALREDEVAAASMGVPLVKTKLLAYATGGALGGMAGAFLGAYNNSVQANVFQFGFSIFILAMVILGGLGSIWGVVLGAIFLSFLNTYFLPEVFNNVPSKLGLDFDATEISFGIFGFIIVLMMVLRPEGLLPERRRKLEFQENPGTDATVYEVRE